MSYRSRVYRQRNTHSNDSASGPFFKKKEDAARPGEKKPDDKIQRKAEHHPDEEKVQKKDATKGEDENKLGMDL